MDFEAKLLKIMNEHNYTIEDTAKLLNISAKTLKKRFDENRMRIADGRKILDILGYHITFEKII